jgi:hypothetical protein
MKRCGLLVLVMIVLAACAGAVTPSTSPLASPAATSTVAPDRTPASPDTFIVYQREGGFAGTSDKWTIYPSGRVVSDDGPEWQVPVEQVAPLLTLVESPGFKELNAKYVPLGVCNDCFTYTLTVYGQGDPQTVTFVDGADWPEPLQQASSAINEVIAR